MDSNVRYDPIFQAIDIAYDPPLEVGKWYFWDEVWTHAIGPYDTEEKARKELADYVRELDAP